MYIDHRNMGAPCDPWEGIESIEEMFPCMVEGGLCLTCGRWNIGGPVGMDHEHYGMFWIRDRARERR